MYQEEIYGRGRFRGYWWSPDSTRIAFLQLNEQPVPEYTVVDHSPYHPELEVTDYPKAGDPNPDVRAQAAHDIELATGKIAAGLEGFVRRWPDQWYIFRPMWPGRPAGAP